jgi:CheY-like chemotaxis protein
MNADGKTIVLLVADSAIDAKLVEGLLRNGRTGQFSFTRAMTLADAIPRLSEPDLHVVILDLNLPDSIGLETLQRMLAPAARVPIVVLTGPDEAVGIQAMRQGAQLWLLHAPRSRAGSNVMLVENFDLEGSGQ